MDVNSRLVHSTTYLMSFGGLLKHYLEPSTRFRHNTSGKIVNKTKKIFSVQNSCKYDVKIQ